MDCHYSIDGYFMCKNAMMTSNTIEHFSLQNYTHVCPPGSYSHRCTISSCTNNLMQGVCQTVNGSIIDITGQNFNPSNCVGKDIIFDNMNNKLTCLYY